MTNTSRRHGILVVVLALVAAFPIFDRSMVAIDEGQIASFATRILRGDVLYRDMYTGIFPGIYYVTSLLFAVFEPDLLVTRYAQVAVNVATALVLWRIGLRIVEPRWALLAPALFSAMIVWGFPITVTFAYSSLSLLAALGAILFLLRYLASGSTRDGIAVGLLLAASALMKQNYGALAGLAVLYGLIDGRLSDRLGGRSLFSALAPVVAAGAAATGVVFVYFAATGALPNLIRYTVETIFASQLEAFDQPIPPLLGPHPTDGRFTFLYAPGPLFSYLIRGETLLGVPLTPAVRSASIRLAYGTALTLLVLAPVVLLLRPGRDRTVRSDARAVVASAWLMFLGLFPSAIFSHLVAVLPPILLLAGIIGERVTGASSPGIRRVLAVAATVVVAFVAVATAAVALDLRRWHPEPLSLARASLHVTPGQASLYRQATRYLERCAELGEPIFVAPDQPLLYFLANRPNATPYEMAIPGDIDTDLLIHRLETSRTRCALYNPRMYVHFGSLGDYYPQIVDYLEREFERVEDISADGRTWYGLVRRKREAS